MKLSIIIPCYNSEAMIRTVVEETIAYMEQLEGYSYEIVLVNDCSADGTFEVIRSLANEYKCVTGVDLAHNAGQHNALLAGMRLADGDLFLSLDDDLQTHPSQVYKLLERLQDGFDVVYGTYEETASKSLFRRIGSSFNDFTVVKLIGKPSDLKVSSFWLIKRFVRDEVIKSQSSFTNLQGLFLRTTSKVTNTKVDHYPRLFGSSGYTLKKLIRQWASFLNYSDALLRLPFVFGIVFLVVTLLHLILLIANSASWNVGVNAVAILVELIAAMMMLVMGVFGEYLNRLFRVVTQDPQYVIKEIVE